MVQFDRSPNWCAWRAVSSHSLPSILWSQMMRRTRSLKISAPPPGMESMPASRSRSSVSRIGDLRAPRQVRDLDHREGLQMHLREALLEAAQHFAVPVQSQLRMQSADDVELGDGFAPALAGAMPHLFERHGVGFGIAHALAEGAQPATGHAHVGGVDVAVDVEVGHVAVQPLAHQVGQVADAPGYRACGRAATPSSNDSRWPASTFSRMGTKRESSITTGMV